jgi:hypothetical protein
MRYQAGLRISLVALGALLGCSAVTPPTGSGGSPGSGGSGTSESTSSASATTGAGGSTTSSSASTGASATTGSGGSGGSGGAGTSTSTSSASSGQGGGGGAGDLDAGPGDSGPPPLKAEVYAHSPDTLYRLDPITKVMTTVGVFGGCSTVIDIALDKNGAMFGTGFGELYKINKATAACTLVATGSYPNSLSFVPAGTVDPVNEALVGYVGASYVRIDTSNGAVTTIGNLGGGYASSGDLVSLIGGSSYLTVTGNGCGDCLVEINPKTGALVNKIGALGHSSVFGLAYWAGTAYGFDAFGSLFQIDVLTAVTTNIPIPNAPAGLVFYGAGSTTAAPLHQ